ncbi:MAG: FAD-binding oxidoreductase [Candidatus Njordarchaeales archaeon]
MEEKKRIINDLKKIVGDEYVETDELAIRLYAKEASGLEAKALAVVFPQTTKEVSEILSYAYEKDLKIYPQGASTDLAGATTPEEEGIILVFDRMNKIKEYSIVDSYIVAEAGARLMEINDLLAKEHYMFPVDPASQKSVTVGGIINSGAGGMRGAKYGTMKEWVMELEIVLPDAEGTILRIGCKTTKCRQGYDLVRLIVGSEGTLAVVTEATLKITPMPENVVTGVGFFDTLEKAMDAVVGIKKARITPYIMEFLDEKTVEIGKQGLNLEWEARGHMVLISVDGPIEAAEKYAKIIEENMHKAGATNIMIAHSQEEAEKLRLFDLRRACYPSAIQLAAQSMRGPESKPFVAIEDIAVPPSRLPEAVKRLRNLEKKYNLPLVIFGHVGDGNLHPTTWVDASDENAKKRLWEMFYEIMDIALELGGTISAEHGIGTLKKKGLRKEFEVKKSLKALELMREIKRVFDPKNILNPGKVI